MNILFRRPVFWISILAGLYAIAFRASVAHAHPDAPKVVAAYVVAVSDTEDTTVEILLAELRSFQTTKFANNRVTATADSWLNNTCTKPNST